MKHWSDCAVHNEPAYPAGECDCGGIPETTKELVEFLSEGKEIDVQTKPNGMLIVQIPRCSR